MDLTAIAALTATALTLGFLTGRAWERAARAWADYTARKAELPILRGSKPACRQGRRLGPDLRGHRRVVSLRAGHGAHGDSHVHAVPPSPDAGLGCGLGRRRAPTASYRRARPRIATAAEVRSACAVCARCHWRPGTRDMRSACCASSRTGVV